MQKVVEIMSLWLQTPPGIQAQGDEPKENICTFMHQKVPRKTTDYFMYLNKMCFPSW